MDAPTYTVAGIASLDLGSEQVDAVYTPRSKNLTLLSVATPVRVTGPMSDPKVSTNPAKIAESTAWQFIHVTDPVGRVVRIPDAFSSDEDGTAQGNGEQPEGEANACVAALATKDKQGHKSHTATIVRAPVKGFNRAWQGVKGWFGGLFGEKQGEGGPEAQEPAPSE